MFGKTVTQYLGFQKVVLVLIVLAFLVRLTLSLAGTPNSVAKWISVTVVLLASGGGDGKNWFHVLAHLVVAAVVLPLVSWGVSSLVMLVTKKVAPRTA